MLGATAAWRGGVPVRLGPAKTVRVLAVLLLHADRAVDRGEIIELVWAGRPPKSAVNLVQKYVGDLRRALGPGVSAPELHGTGYLLRLGPDELDSRVFEGLLDRARQADAVGRLGDAERLLAEALALWRGPAFGDLDVPAAAAERARLDELRVTAREDHADLALRTGDNTAAIARLRHLTAEHPLRERARELHMLALYRNGRQADALAVYADLRTVLADELGIDPGPSARAMHERILRNDPALARPAPAVTLPRQLPARVPNFTGRAAELRRLTEVLEAARDTMRIVTISGSAGIGKTTLAVQWAYEVRERFPDGQLYVNLRGFEHTGARTSPEAAVRGFLEALGVPSQRVPVTLDASTALFRSRLDGKRVLVLLDNAADAEQVRPLLPAAPGCLVVLTSRHQLASLVTLEDAEPISLDLLTGAEARDLLASRLGSDRVGAEPDAVEEIVTRCARLPLALAIVAARARTRPGTPLATLAEELRDAPNRLDALAGEDPAADPRTVLSWSYHRLPSAAARLFRLLGLHVIADIALEAAACLADLPVPAARELMSELTEAHLATESSRDRFVLHDLLRAYAAELVTCQESGSALNRLYDHYVSGAATAMNALHPAETEHWTRATGYPSQDLPEITQDAARTWLDTELPTLVAITEGAGTRHVMTLSTILFRYLESGHYTDGLTVHTSALAVARRLGDRASEAHTLSLLGNVHTRLGDYATARDHHQSAIRLHRAAGDRSGEARTLNWLSVVDWRIGQYHAAEEDALRALALAEELDDPDIAASSLGSLGVVTTFLGKFDDAVVYYRRALDHHRAEGDRYGEARTLSNLGLTLTRTGHDDEAAEYFQAALSISRDLGIRFGEAETLTNLGGVHSRQGRASDAVDCLRRALVIFRETRERYGEIRALNGLGEAELASGRPGMAVSHHMAAVSIAAETDNHDERARAHIGLGHAHLALGSPADARSQWLTARDIYAGLASPRLDDIPALLDLLPDESE